MVLRIIIIFTLLCAGWIYYTHNYKVVTNSASLDQKTTVSVSEVTSSWQTFSNDKFTFEYPSDWEIQTETWRNEGLPSTIIVFNPREYVVGDRYSPKKKFYFHQVEFVSYKVTSEPAQGWADRYLEDRQNGPLGPPVILRTIKDSFDQGVNHYEIVGIMRQKSDYDTPVVGSYWTNFIISNGKAQVTGESSIHDTSRTSKEYKILSTFKFK